MKQNSIPQPQLGAASALVQLLAENPDLPLASWSIGEFTLHGHIHDASFAELETYAQVLGGSIRPHGDFVLRGETVRPHYLHSMWRDVPVEVVVVLPVAVQTAVAA
ncbi:hypothetical protein ACFWXI_14680 [[Kitasatospora] papulosa]|uniref:hypothetical protein n=1 Tax=[Kitasatospora] papulosa TaxID=1464011 RepID=UPI003697AEAB